MGSGEGDVAYLKVTPIDNNVINNSINTGTSTGDLGSFDSPSYWPIGTGTYTWPTYYYYNWSSPIYLYQIRCPKTGCKKFNWLQLDIITPCTNCGARLKAVSEQPDFTVAVKK